MTIFCIWNIIIGLYRVARQGGHPQAPVPKLKRGKCELNQQPLQSALPPIDEYLVGIQTRQTLVIDDNSSLLTPLKTRTERNLPNDKTARSYSRHNPRR